MPQYFSGLDSSCPTPPAKIPGMNNERQPLDLGKILLPYHRYTFPTRRGPRCRLLPVRLCRAFIDYLAGKLRLNPPGYRRLPAPILNHRTSAVLPALSLSHAIRVRSAEYWLILGEPLEALAELQLLPEAAKRNPEVIKVMVSATGLLRVRRE